MVIPIFSNFNFPVHNLLSMTTLLFNGITTLMDIYIYICNDDTSA